MQADPAAAPSSPVEPHVPGRATTIARVEAFRSFEAAAPVWQALQSADCLMTPYQRYDLMSAWYRHLGDGLEPLIVVGYDDAGQPLLLCPFGIERRHGLRIVRFLGGRHSNSNMAIWRRSAAAQADAAAVTALLQHIGRLDTAADALALTNQPVRWDGIANPFALLPHQLSPSFMHSGALSDDFEALAKAQIAAKTRKELKRQERRLTEHGPIRVFRADSVAERSAVCQAFFSQKAARMAVLGIENIFAEPQTAAFVNELVGLDPVVEHPAVEFFALQVGNEIAATYAAIGSGPRLSLMFNSIAGEPLAACSPGQILLLQLMRMTGERGYTRFDMGVGEANYKKAFCRELEPLFDGFHPLSAKGRVAALAYSAFFAAKRFIKQQPLLWKLVTSWRRMRASQAPAD